MVFYYGCCESLHLQYLLSMAILQLACTRIYLMSSQGDIDEGYCQCSVCEACLVEREKQQPRVESTIVSEMKYSLYSFIELFPRNFPLAIVTTACPQNRNFYFNRGGNRLMVAPFTKVTDHFPLAINVALFYPDRCHIAHKYEIIREDPSFTYVQVYSPNPPFAIEYRADEEFMDEVLSEKLVSLVKNIIKSDNFDLSFSQKDFLVWVHKDYQDEIFCKFMTKFYCAVIEKMRRDCVVSGTFQWIIEKPGTIRLSNVKYLVIEKNTKSATFQEEYEEKIMEKLRGRDPVEVQIFNAFTKKSKINYRITNFKNSIRQIFNQEKLKILKNTEKERTVDSKTESDDVARLFLPQLHKYSNLREVLNDEVKFKRVVLGIEERSKPEGSPGPLRRGKSMKDEAQHKKVKSRHHRSKTEV